MKEQEDIKAASEVEDAQELAQARTDAMGQANEKEERIAAVKAVRAANEAAAREREKQDAEAKA